MIVGRDVLVAICRLSVSVRGRRAVAALRHVLVFACGEVVDATRRTRYLRCT